MKQLNINLQCVCIYPYYVPLAKKLLKGTNVVVCTVIGFPTGESTKEVKVYEAIDAVEKGANEIDMVIFFRDPLDAESYEPDVFSLLRLCDMHNIPIATNLATAEVLIHGLERGDLAWRDIVNPKK